MSINLLRGALLGGGALAATTMTAPAFAQSQTASGTTVNNQASVSYDVGGST